MIFVDPTGIYNLYHNSGFGQWVTDLTNFIISSNFFQNYGLLVMFLWQALPTLLIPIPLAFFMIPLVYSGINPIYILIVATGGAFVGSFVFYFIAKYSIIKLRNGMSNEIDESAFVHRHRWWIFVVLPIFFITGDGLMIYAGAKHMPIHKFVIPLIIGSFSRIIINLLIIMGLFAWFPSIPS